VLALGGLAACGDDDSAGLASQQNEAFNPADVMFAQMMIPHHRQAVEMAKLAASRAKDARVKKLAAQIAAAQQPEIDIMTSWLTSWHKPMDANVMAGMDPGMDMHGMADDAAMKKLSNASGAAFDRQFLALMVVHHQGAIEMAKTEIVGGKFPAAVALAKEIKKAQAAEIARMKKLQKA
jgi:uncharacterized protein (DUF305 family)